MNDKIKQAAAAIVEALSMFDDNPQLYSSNAGTFEILESALKELVS